MLMRLESTQGETKTPLLSVWCKKNKTRERSANFWKLTNRNKSNYLYEKFIGQKKTIFSKVKFNQ